MINVVRNADLKEMNSFGVDARVETLVSFSDTMEFGSFLYGNPEYLREKWSVIGQGNNILFTQDFKGTLFHPMADAIEITAEEAPYVYVRAEAGLDWDTFVEWSVSHDLWGLENLSNVPSSVGAAPVQNIGAYGAEVKDVIVSVEMLEMETLKPVTLACGHCAFGYRDSIFKHILNGKVIITAVNFRLSRVPAPKLEYGALNGEVEKLGGPSPRNIRQAVLNIRSSKLPDPSDIGNAGSFFKNPLVSDDVAVKLKKEYPDMPTYNDKPGMVKLAAGWLIEQTGWKGRGLGPAGVYEKQALILVNRGGAAGADIVALAKGIQKDVADKFGVTIEPEVNIW